MRRCLFIILMLLSFVGTLLAGSKKFTLPASDRIKTNIDFGWRYYRGDVSGEEETHQVNQRPWKNVNLPHEWSMDGPYNHEHNLTNAFLPMEIGWYRKGLKLPHDYKDKQLYLVFDGVYRESDVWMNYFHLGHHSSGYTSFAYDITNYVRTGNQTPNGIRVRVDGCRHEQDAYEGTGIYRHVWLVAVNKLHIANWGTFVSTPNVTDKKAKIKIQTRLLNAGKLARQFKLITKIVDVNGRIVAEVSSTHELQADSEQEFVQTTEVHRPHRWDVDDPYLYKAYSIVEENNEIIDTFVTPFGVRTFCFDANKGFFLNGRHLKLKGFNEHHDFAGLGRALPDRIHWNAMMSMKKAGFNFFRASHNPATPERLDVCDEIGMLVWNEIDRKLVKKEILLPKVRETIIRDRNHPSIILWALENESPLESTVYGAECMKAGTDLAHELDPTRPTTFAPSMPVSENGYGDAVGVVAYNYNWPRADRDHMENPEWKMMGISEYAAKRCRRGVYGIEHFARAENDNYFDLYDGEIKNVYEMCKSVEGYWMRINSREYMGGGCIWSGMDYWGSGDIWPLNSRSDGLLDLCFFPKDSYYYFVSQWVKEPMLHIFPHWNWENSNNKEVKVWSYSNCDEVELFLNGRSLGKQKRPKQPPAWDPKSYKKENTNTKKYRLFERKNFVEDYPQHLVWTVPFEAGTLRAEGRNKGNVVYTKDIKTAGKPARIDLTPMMTQFVEMEEIPPFVADGRDIVTIKATIVDKNGNVVPNADNLVHFSVDGDNKVIGVGNGDIVSHEPNRVNYRQAYNGLCLVIVQTSTTSGKFTVTATSEGLTGGKISLTSIMPEPTHLVLSAFPYKIEPGETSEITVGVVDKFGSFVSADNKAIDLTINGPALFTIGKDRMKVDVKNGRATVGIKPNGKAGEVSVTGKSKDGLVGKVRLVVK